MKGDRCPGGPTRILTVRVSPGGMTDKGDGVCNVPFEEVEE